MLKRTPGKWVWDFSKAPESYGKPGIFIADDDGGPLTPTMGDLELMAHAPEIHEALWQVIDSLREGLKRGAFQTEKDKDLVFGIGKRIEILLRDINVERQDTDKEARR